MPDQESVATNSPDIEQVLGIDLREDPPEQGPVCCFGSRAVTHPLRHPGVLEQSDEALFVLGDVRLQKQPLGAQSRGHRWRRYPRNIRVGKPLSPARTSLFS